MIQYIDCDTQECSNKHLWYNGPGYYWSDESCCLNGPWLTEEEAQADLDSYLLWCENYDDFTPSY